MSNTGIAWIASQARRSSRNQLSVLRSIPDIISIEAQMGVRGILWSVPFAAECDHVSLALFGVTAADTRPVEPHPDAFDDQGRSSYSFSDKALAAYDAALSNWYSITGAFSRYDANIEGLDLVPYWKARGFDITGADGAQLRCFALFARQLFAAWKRVVPGAALTLDGSGRRAAPNAEDWGTALEAEARLFRSRTSGGR